MTVAERIREEFRMAYPAHHPTVQQWGEATWTALDLLLDKNPALALLARLRQARS